MLAFCWRRQARNGTDSQYYKDKTTIIIYQTCLLHKIQHLWESVFDLSPFKGSSGPIYFHNKSDFINPSNMITPWSYRNPIYINIARDPVDLFISNYYYLRFGFQNAKNGTNAQNWKRDMPDERRNMTIDECTASGNKNQS